MKDACVFFEPTQGVGDLPANRIQRLKLNCLRLASRNCAMTSLTPQRAPLVNDLVGRGYSASNLEYVVMMAVARTLI